MAEHYERDEFDEIASEGGPVGVHRAPRSWWSRVLPPVLAFIIAGALAFGIAVFLWNRDVVSAPAPSVSPTLTVTPSAEPTVSPSPEPPSPEPSPSPTETEEPEPVIVYEAEVHVRNGAAIAGLAGTQQELLGEAGYTDVVANNISSELIPGGVNTVVYDGEELADTAQDIADTLGIEAVAGGGTPGGAQIEVLLATDPGA